jgi:superfamily I DNA/RNA helicase
MPIQPKKPASKLAAKIKANSTNTPTIPPHLMIIARAGTGKTTTLVEGLKHLKGMPTKITPSEQQAKIWEQLKLSESARTICFVAFNKSIADELKQRVPAGCDAMTMHSMGLKACSNAFPILKANGGVNFDKLDRVVESVMGGDIRDLRRQNPMVVEAVKRLTDLVRCTLSDTDYDSLSELAATYDVELNESRTKIFELVPQLVEACKDVNKFGCIDGCDMIWLPVVLNLPLFRYDLLLVDEAQDLNRAQQELAKRAGRRLILCGDPKQAIYGFAGADSQSMPRMERDLTGCVTLPLTVTRRCGKAIVAEAQKLVSDFEAHESNGEGVIERMSYPMIGTATSPEVSWEKSYAFGVCPDDMIICRTNAPLVSQCLGFIKRKIKANILGRNISTGLLSLINKLNADSVETLTAKLLAWSERERQKELEKKTPSEPKLMAISDKVDCLMAFIDGAESVADVVAIINKVFCDEKQSTGIRLASIHKSKGLEAHTVYLLQPPEARIPHPMAKTKSAVEQEYNLLYVAITRAISRLVYVS